MQINLDKSDRRLLMWAGIILLPIVVLLAMFSGPEEEGAGYPTTYSAQTGGAKGAYLFLKEQGYNVERWEQAPEELPDAAANTVLVLAGPFGSPTKEEKNFLHMYLNRGGKILSTGYSGSMFLPIGANAVPEVIPEAVWKEYQPEILSPLTRAGTIKMSPKANWDMAMPGQLVHYAENGKGVVVSYKVGQGEIIWWADVTPLTNAGIREAGNLNLLLYSLGGRDVHILWDEYFHSHRASEIGFLSFPAVKYGLAQCVLLFLVVMFTFARRNAPIRPLVEPSRLTPLEFVHTLGNLYRQSRATRIALEVPYKRFCNALIKRLALRSDVSTAEIVRAAQARLGYKDPDLEETLKQILMGLTDPDNKEARALELVQRLNRHAANLKIIYQEEEENTPHANRLSGAGARTH